MDNGNQRSRDSERPGLSIPLQTLPRPNDGRNGASRTRRGQSDNLRLDINGRHDEEGDSRGRATTFSSPLRPSYQRVAEDSPSPPLFNNHRVPQIVVPNHDDEFFQDEHLSPTSPAAAAQLQEAMGGLAFGDSSAEGGYANGWSPPEIRARGNSAHSDRSDIHGVEARDYFSAEPENTPLNSSRGARFTSGLSPGSSGALPRSSMQSIRLSPGRAGMNRLGDDLRFDSEGFRSRQTGMLSPRSGRASSPGAASTLDRANSMLRQMSQRVVNLSNEPEQEPQALQRKPSQQSQRKPSPERPEVMNGEPKMTTAYFNGSAMYRTESEKAPNVSIKSDRIYAEQVNPLRGNTLGIFGPNNPIRLFLCELLVHSITEPLILILIIFQVILLTIDSWGSVYDSPRSISWSPYSWTDWALFALFTMYTLEILAKVIVSGLILNPNEYSTINRKEKGFIKGVRARMTGLLNVQKREAIQDRFGDDPFLESDAHHYDNAGMSKRRSRALLARRAFLRHSFSRLDFLAVVSFWISFTLSITGVQTAAHLYVFQMMSCLRILRLLGLTRGTSVILKSLKKAAPLLVQVALLMSFFWILFAIIGIQSFKSSFRRQCVWRDSNGVQPDYVQPLVFCGGQLDNVTGLASAYVDSNYNPVAGPKGYICPQQSWCVVGDNPYNGTVSFDNIANSLELVFVVMSSNTWSDLMYYLSNSDYLAACLFFAAGIVILSMWLMTLFLAVVTSSFSVTRELTKQSAFSEDPKLDEVDEGHPPSPTKGLNHLTKLYKQTEFVWLGFILLDLVAQATRTATMSDGHERFIWVTELIVTLVLDIEIIIRIAIDFRKFWTQPRNVFDLILAIVTSIMQIPPIRNSGQAYAWMTVFQIMRIYRLVMAVKMTRDTVRILLTNWRGMVNLVIFVLLICYLGALFAVQLFRGEIPQGAQDPFGNTLKVTFFTLFNAFLGMYQIFSTENWTAVMYGITGYATQYNVGWIGAVFCILWFTVGSVIVLSMFIAVIQEAFDIHEDEKRIAQVKFFIQTKPKTLSSTPSLAVLFKTSLGRPATESDPFDYGSALARDSITRDKDFQEFIRPVLDSSNRLNRQSVLTLGGDQDQVSSGVMTRLWTRFKALFPKSEYNPFYTTADDDIAAKDLDIETMGTRITAAADRRRILQREYLQKHPNYNVSLFIFRHDNHIRRICQRIVGAGRGGNRPPGEGVAPNPYASSLFSFVVYVAIFAMVVLAVYTTPLYMKVYFETHDFSVRNWFVFCDMGFAVFFTIEAVIRVIADGAFFTPNAFFRGSWGIIDGIVLITLWVNVGTSLANQGAISRAVGAFKALRALRLLHISRAARETFYAVIIVGGLKLASIAFVSLSLLVPFALWGLNLFNGQLVKCNDTNIGIIDQCVGEFTGTPFNNLNVLQPRVASNPYYSFDDFGASLFILFQTTSQTGWIDVMWSLQSITGKGSQPQYFASQGNAVFMVMFNLLGAVFIVTLFISVFMKNYTETTGVAFYTSEQRAWMEMKKLLRIISPSPSKKSEQSFVRWCYRRATQKHGWWHRSITAVLCVHCILLMLEFYPEPPWWETAELFLFLGFTLIYITNIIMRIIGLSWLRYRRSSWDLFAILAVGGTFISTVLTIARPDTTAITQIRKLFLVSIALLLIPRNAQLDQLFKTGAASISPIANLFVTWLVLFLVFSIALTQTFSLTRFGSSTNGNLNFRTFAKALILLFRTSIGEGWNQIMEDYASIKPPYCNDSEEFFNSDCGSPEWARGLFVAWNVLSMYLFLNLMLALIYESFSYVYQRSTGLRVINRDEIRKFKHAWAEFDPEGTGYIKKEDFPRLLAELSGIFEVSIYRGEFSVKSILEECRLNNSYAPQAMAARGRVMSDMSAKSIPFMSRTSTGLQKGPASPDDSNLGTGVDLHLLRTRLNQIPVQEIQERRKKYERLFEEATIAAHPTRGIPFNFVLMLLSYTNIIDDQKDLTIEEFFARRKRLDRIQESIDRRTVKGFFDMLFYRRRFCRTRERRAEGFMHDVPNFAVPEIMVEGVEEDADEGGPASTKIEGIGADHWSRTNAQGNRRSVTRPLSGRLNTTLPPEINVTGAEDDVAAGTGINDTHLPSQLSPGLGRSSTTAHSPGRTSLAATGLSPARAASARLSVSPSHIRAGSSEGGSARSSGRMDMDMQTSLENSPWGQSIRRRSVARRRRSTRTSRNEWVEGGLNIWGQEMAPVSQRNSSVEPSVVGETPEERV